MGLRVLKVGDAAVFDGTSTRAERTTITRVGRKYIYAACRPKDAFDIETGRLQGGYGYLMTEDGYALAIRAQETRARCLRAGVTVSYRLSRERTIEIFETLEPLFARWEQEEGAMNGATARDPNRLSWSVEVIGGDDGADYRTVFRAGVQTFELARVPCDDVGGMTHCHHIARMFREALGRLGL